MQNSQNPIILIDTKNLVYSQFKEKELDFNSQGKDCSVILKSINTINKLFKTYNPQYMVFALESENGNFRKDMYPQYKSKRRETNPLLKQQYPVMVDIFKYIGFPLFKADGFEADDVIGTIAKSLSKQGYKVIIYSQDKDFIQLIDDNISILANFDGHMETYDKKNGAIRFNVPIEYTIDVIAIGGDEGDNIPGVKGVRKNSAADIINEYGGINDIYNRIDNGTFEFTRYGKSVEEMIHLLQNSREDAFLSYKLATIKTDVYCDEEITLDKFAMKPCNSLALHNLFREWEVGELSVQFLGKDFPFVIDPQEVARQFMMIMITEELTWEEVYRDMLGRDPYNKGNKEYEKRKKKSQQIALDKLRNKSKRHH